MEFCCLFHSVWFLEIHWSCCLSELAFFHLTMYHGPSLSVYIDNSFYLKKCTVLQRMDISSKYLISFIMDNWLFLIFSNQDDAATCICVQTYPHSCVISQAQVPPSGTPASVPGTGAGK